MIETYLQLVAACNQQPLVTPKRSSDCSLGDSLESVFVAATRFLEALRPLQGTLTEWRLCGPRSFGSTRG